MDKEELYEELKGNVWEELSGRLQRELQQNKDELCNLNFIDENSKIKAISLQAKIEAIQYLFDEIESIKEEVSS